MAINIITCSLLICEKLLVEADGITSAIRIVDVFYVPHPAPEMPIIGVEALLTLRVKGYDESDHLLDVILLAPSGAEAMAVSGYKVNIEPKIGEAGIGGFSAGTRLNFKAEPGLYYVVAMLDGEEIARAPFTVRRASDQTNQNAHPTQS
jgi:hypothetical protein